MTAGPASRTSARDDQQGQIVSTAVSRAAVPDVARIVRAKSLPLREVIVALRNQSQATRVLPRLRQARERRPDRCSRST
jgi:hypothetical protein